MATDNIQQWPETPAESRVRDVEPLLESILTKFPVTELLVVNGGQRATQNRHEWFDDQITEKGSVLTADITAHAANATGVSITVSSTANFLVADQVFIDTLSPVYQITAIPDGVTLTVTEIRGVALGSTSGNGLNITCSRAALELSSYSNFQGARLGTQVYNFTHIFRANCQLTEEEEEAARMGSIYTQTNLWQNAQARALEQLAWKMYRQITTGVAIERTGTSIHGMLGGVRQFIDVPGGNVVAASGALTITHLNTAAQYIFEDTGDLSNIAIIVPTAQSQAIAAFDANSRRYIDPGTNTATGVNTSVFIPNISNTPPLPIYIDQNLPRNEIWFIDRRRLQLIPFGSQTMRFREERTPGVTALQGFFTGTYTLVVRNGATAHGIINNLTV